MLRYQRHLLHHLVSGDDLYRQRAAVRRWSMQPLVSIVTPVFETAPDALRRMLDSVRRQSYPRWQHCLVDDGSAAPWLARHLERLAEGDARVRFRRRAENGGIVAASNDALDLATGEFVAFLDHDDVLEPDALFRMVEVLGRAPETDVIYSDLGVIDPKGRRIAPVLVPDWSPELLLSAPYVVHLTVFRRALVEAVGRLRPGLEGAQDYDLVLRVSELTDRFVHVPRILYHWCMGPSSAAGNLDAKPYATIARHTAVADHLARIGAPAEVDGCEIPNWHRVRFEILGRPTVSLIVRLGDAPIDRSEDRIAKLLGGLGRWDGDLTLVGAQNAIRELGRRLAATLGQRLFLQASDDDSTMHPDALAARGDHLLFVDESLEPASAAWVSGLLEFSQQPAIGAVAPMVIAADDSTEETGVVIPRGTPHPARRGQLGKRTHPFFWEAWFPRNVLAVSDACFMTRHDVFDKASGLRSRGDVGFPAIDYCLRLRELGHRVVVNPRSELRRAEASRRWTDDSEGLRIFRERWASRLDEIDPFYNPSFRQDDGSFVLPESPG